MVGIEFLELGVKVLLHLEGSIFVEDEIITGVHVGKNIKSKYLLEKMLDGRVNNCDGSILFEFHIVLDLCDGDIVGRLVGINDKSPRIAKLWIRITIIFGGAGVDND